MQIIWQELVQCEPLCNMIALVLSGGLSNQLCSSLHQHFATSTKLYTTCLLVTFFGEFWFRSCLGDKKGGNRLTFTCVKYFWSRDPKKLRSSGRTSKHW